MRSLGSIALIILLLTPMAHGAEQETVEKYFKAFFNRDFDLMASYIYGSDKPEIRSRRITNFKNFFKEGEENLAKMYEKKYKGKYLSNTYEPETLITFGRGENRDGNPVVLAIYTEKHRVKINGKLWQFFWQMKYLITLKEGKIAEIKAVDMGEDNLLMILKPEDCIKPAACD